MTFTIKPQLAKFVDDQVKSGRFNSADEVLEAGIERLMLDSDPDVLDEQDLVSLEKSQAQIDRGELIDAEELHAKLRQRYTEK